MTAAPVSSPEPPEVPFVHASPAQVRTALTPKDAAEFDRQWRTVMVKATQDLDLTEVMATLDSWRRIAWVTSTTGRDRYQEVLDSAEDRLRTGERHAEAVPWNQLKVELGLDR